MIRAFVSAFFSSRVFRHIISRLPTQQSQKLKSPLPIEALKRTKHKTKSSKVTTVWFFLLVTNACSNCQHTNKNEPPRLFLFITCIRYNKKRKADTFGFGFARVGDDASCQILVAHSNCECRRSAFNIVDATCDSDRRAQMKAHDTLRLHSHLHRQVLLLAHMHKCSRC